MNRILIRMRLLLFRSILPLWTAALCCAQGGRVTGVVTPQLAGFDKLMLLMLDRYNVEGAALAVARDGRLVLAHGYGMADREGAKAVQPDSLFRIASLSKPFTATAVLKLVEKGRLRLDDRAFAILGLAEPADARIAGITIRQLLLHAGGWDRAKSFDPMFIPQRAAQAVGGKAPASCETVIRYMLKQPLDFDPGSRAAYSNFGYCVLGRVIEKVTGQSYEADVREEVLAPAGITRMRIGHSLLKDRAPGEVRYYDVTGATKVPTVFPAHAGLEPRPYGGFFLEAMDSHGGWIASSVELARFLTHVGGTAQPPLLQPGTVAQMVERPDARIAVSPDAWYALGWQVRKVAKGTNWWHTGALPGTTSLMVRTAEGMCWAVLFNGSPRALDRMLADVDAGLWKAARAVKLWPEHDLFMQYR
jgi:CubicO group peptidase (beta-lactamase class C family)